MPRYVVQRTFPESAGKQTTFCVYDAPNPEAIRKTAESNEVPVDRITQVRVLDPYFHH